MEMFNFVVVRDVGYSTDAFYGTREEGEKYFQSLADNTTNLIAVYWYGASVGGLINSYTT